MRSLDHASLQDSKKWHSILIEHLPSNDVTGKCIAVAWAGLSEISQILGADGECLKLANDSVASDGRS